MKKISVRNAYLHNLKNIDVDLPAGKLIAVCGVSGSGKSTLAFDILFEAGRRSYLQALGVLASLEGEHGFDEITGLMPTVAIKQGIVRRSNPRSVVGTKTRLLNYLAMLYADQCKRGIVRDIDPDRSNTFVGGDASVNAILPSQFSFNSPMGMCLSCQGRGIRFELDLAVLLPTPETTLSQLFENALAHTTYAKRIVKLQEKLDLNPTTPFQSLPQAIQELVLYGKTTAGIRQASLFDFLQHRLNRGKPVNGAIRAGVCSDCEGYRVGEVARNILVNGKHIGQLGLLTIDELHEHLTHTAQQLAGKKADTGAAAGLLIEKALSIVAQLIAVKLDYLTAYRPVPSLSGGEMQRLFLMSHLQADIAPLLYIFDEPTSGLHELEKLELIERLKTLSRTGNTVAVVEHDSQSLEAADYVVDIGPLAGTNGGEVVYQGSVAGLKRCKQSLTGQCLSGKRKQSAPATTRNVISSSPKLVLRGVKTNNLHNLTVRIPLGVLVGVAGMSGSGKSSLIADTLVPLVSQMLSRVGSGADAVAANNLDSGGNGHTTLDRQKNSNREKKNKDKSGGASSIVESDDQNAEISLTKATPVFTSLHGIEHLDKCIEISQAPIGRRSNSNVVSYLGVWDRIRSRFANTDHAIQSGFTAGHFSFNAAGACPQCRGNGQIDMWLGGAFVSYPCDDCKGQRYLEEILDVKYKGNSVTDVLAASIGAAKEIFADDVPLTRMLNVVSRTGMDYITLGQPTNTLSGGEAQRVKLARELGRSRKGVRCLYVLDEPTTGLSLYDTGKLMTLLQELVSLGNSVIVVEHDPGVLSQCDWLIELGPDSGRNGGKLIASGAPDTLKRSSQSLIGPFLQ